MSERYIGFQTVIDELNISPATLRNWLKTGQLLSSKTGMIDTDSYHYFKQYILRQHKLNKRANKQYATSTSLSTKPCNPCHIHQPSFAYENSLNPAERNKKGIYYTPDNVIASMFDAIDKPDKNHSFLDPCCGSGNFLINALKKGFSPENIYGFDVDETALEIATERFYQATGTRSKNIKKLNLLEEQLEEHQQKYHTIFTNPPWGYKFSAKQKQVYADKFNHGVKVDSSALFVQIALSLLAQGGYLGVLLPDAFFHIRAFQLVRQTLLQKKIIQLANHGRAFKGLQTKAYSVVIKNKKAGNDVVTCFAKHRSYHRTQKSFLTNPNAMINLDTTDEEQKVIEHLYAFPHQTLKGKATWGLGIVTGDNQKYLSKAQKIGQKPIYKGNDIERGNIKQASYYFKDDFSVLQQTANKNFYLASKKVVYRFINSSLIFAMDTQQRYFLNSANFLILSSPTQSPLAEDTLSLSEEQLVFLMNTTLMSWLFQKLFNTHKILRSDLEKLPLFGDYFHLVGDSYTEDSLYRYLQVKKEKNTFRIAINQSSNSKISGHEYQVKNLLIKSDNKQALHYLLTEEKLEGKVDLIYIDPPFATNSNFTMTDDRASTISHSKKGRVAYSDKLMGSDFIDFLRERLILLRQLLSEKGSIYLHIDYKIGHYVKVLMDEIFGIENFKNDITRIKCNPKNFARCGYSNIKDLILFYTKSAKPIWHEPIETYTDKEREKLFPKVNPQGRRYTTVPIHAPGETEKGKSNQPFRGIMPPKGRHWRTDVSTLEQWDKEGLIEWSSTGNPRKMIFADEKKAKEYKIFGLIKTHHILPTQRKKTQVY